MGQGLFESDDDYRARIAREASEQTIKNISGSSPSQGFFESDTDYASRISKEASEHRILDASGSAPSQRWLESDDSYRSRVEREANGQFVAAATGRSPSQGWLESDEEYDVRVRKEANEHAVAAATGRSPSQGWLEADQEYRARVAHEAREATVQGRTAQRRVISTAESSTQSYYGTSSRAGHSAPAASSFAGLFVSVTVIVLLYAILGGAFRDNKIERSSGLVYSPISEAELPMSMSPPAKTALLAWLNKNPHFRPATESDCSCADDLVHIRKSYANQFPYYAVGDFNSDGLTDFAVVVVDRSISTAAAPPHNFNSSVVIFSSTVASVPLKPFLLGAIGVPNSSLLFVSRENGALAVGQPEGEVSPIAYSAGRYTYQ